MLQASKLGRSLAARLASFPCPGCGLPKQQRVDDPPYTCLDACGFPLACSSACAESADAGHSCEGLAGVAEDLVHVESGEAQAPTTSAQLGVPRERLLAAMTSWEGYIAARPVGPDAELNMRVAAQLRLVSSVFTFPLTLVHYLRQLPAPRKGRQGKKRRAVVDVAVLGARAEASLPEAFWREAPLLLDAPVHLHFVGPELQRAPPDAGSVGARLTTTRKLGVAEEPPAEGAVAALFNPGLGHPATRDAWKPSLPLLEGRSVIATAFSQADLHSDLAALRAALGREPEFLVEPERNPFGSLRGSVDGELNVAYRNQWGYAFRF